MVKFMYKCNKYETLFIFQNDEAALLKHIQNCGDCRKVYEEDQKLDALIKEVKPYFNTVKKIPLLKLKAVASLVIVFLCFFAAGNLSINKIAMNQSSQGDLLKNEPSIVEAMGLPADEYGLLNVE